MSYKTQHEFELKLIQIFGLEEVARIHSINLKITAHEIPILAVEIIPDESEQEQLVNLLKSYNITLTPKGES